MRFETSWRKERGRYLEINLKRECIESTYAQVVRPTPACADVRRMIDIEKMIGKSCRRRRLDRAAPGVDEIIRRDVGAIAPMGRLCGGRGNVAAGQLARQITRIGESHSASPGVTSQIEGVLKTVRTYLIMCSQSSHRLTGQRMKSGEPLEQRMNDI